MFGFLILYEIIKQGMVKDHTFVLFSFWTLSCYKSLQQFNLAKTCIGQATAQGEGGVSM